MVKVLVRTKGGYVLDASKKECNAMIKAGIKIQNAQRYGLKAIRSKRNATTSDNLKKLRKL